MSVGTLNDTFPDHDASTSQLESARFDLNVQRNENVYVNPTSIRPKSSQVSTSGTQPMSSQAPTIGTQRMSSQTSTSGPQAQQESSPERLANSLRDLSLNQVRAPIVVNLEEIPSNGPRLSNEEVAFLKENHADQLIYLRSHNMSVPVKL